ncbi:hypothetical protein [Pontibacter sp. G13]|uniref:hypothetical protein n=1 Tax=Pontibacter sp. G13 TaxID=3074898 RepID=UPI00288A08AE|nr:hypothetical protein [Pontibacter sp. G13]WNJ16614.1 hypothetical protein RJD25_17250 [Pontibacter sp. G13]
MTVCASLVNLTVAQQSASAITDLLATDSIWHIDIRTDWNHLFADRSDSLEYQRAYVTWQIGDSLIERKAKVRLRGNFRRRADVCSFPPFKLRFSKEQRAGTPFQMHKHLKVVTHCMEESFLLREYLVYRTYEKLTPYSFRARLVKITYSSTQDTIPSQTYFAVLLEDDKTLAKRLGGELWEGDRLKPEQVDRQELTLLALFQYMIGNLDWDISLHKNVDFVQIPGKEQPVVVPFDFDYSAMVNPPYTGITPSYDRRRIGGWLCRDREEYNSAVQTILANKDEILELYRKFPHLSSQFRQEPAQYIRSFFREAKRPTFLDLLEEFCEEEG